MHICCIFPVHYTQCKRSNAGHKLMVSISIHTPIRVMLFYIRSVMILTEVPILESYFVIFFSISLTCILVSSLFFSFLHHFFSNYPLKFFSLVVAISNALFNKTIRPANMPMSKAAMEAAITAANANDTFRTIRQQTPPTNIPQSRNQSHHSSSHRNYR